MTNISDNKDIKLDAKDVETTVVASLNESLDDVSDHAKQRLYEARRAALTAAQQVAENKKSLGNYWHSLWKPLLPVAMAASLLVAVFVLQSPQQGTDFNPDWEEDSELLFSADELELYENLEFYIWLSEIENG